MSNNPRDFGHLSRDRFRLIMLIKALASSAIEERMMLKCSLMRKKKLTKEEYQQQLACLDLKHRLTMLVLTQVILKAKTTIL
jgi:hypothetical protein